MISKQTIARILEDARIEEVVGEFVKLKKSGQNYKGLSPFTAERNPSFYVSPAKGIFKCFSSGKGGNVVNFLMEHEHFTYPEALTYLAKKYGIAIEEDSITPEDVQIENERETLFQVTAFAMNFFMQNLHETEAGKAIGLEYFKSRDLKPDTIKKFQLGYSPESWDAFTKNALENGYKLEYLEKTGLTITKDGRSYDRFRGRVIFPIHNITGRILGFGGRTLLKDDHVPKYVNSIESEIYSKSQTLYGLYFAKSAIIRLDNCYLVEGYTDVISMHQAGIENVVASSGTALTEEQIRLIKRYTPNITILYDGDPAGIKASFRGIDMVLEQGMNVRIVLFPDGEDPDSYARKHRRAELEELITGGAQDFIRFKTSLLLKEAANDPIKRAGLIKEIVGSISLIPDPIYRSVYIKECSTLMDVQEQMLMSSLNKILYQKNRKQAEQEAARQEVEIPEMPAPKQVEQVNQEIESQEYHLIRLLLLYSNYDIEINEQDELAQKISVARYITEEVNKDDLKFANPVYQKIFDLYNLALLEGNEPDEKLLINDGQDQELISEVITILSSRYELSENWLKKRILVNSEKEKLLFAVESTLLSFKEKTIDRMINEILQEIKVTASEEDIMLLQTRHKNYKEISIKINQKLGRIITK
ncbi:MAG TPA: DNA primase [Bacteroidales bacterium]|nr:DNA primase [Bacteroidales bacterium]HPI84814.1 DNA primase [Bacteroidales bacterium]HPM91895.1 DNA primase [Bacteroidales bacterium]